MFRSLGRSLVIAIGCLSACTGGAASLAADAAPPAPVKGQRIFTCGHSFHYFMPKILTDIAAKAHIEGHVQVGVSAIGGSRVIQHWDLPEGKNQVKPALETGKIDVLTLSPIYLPDPGIEKLVEYALKYNPDIRVTVQEFWLPFESQEAWEPTKRPKSIDRDSMTVDQLRSAHAAYFQSMDDHVRSLNDKFGKQVVFVVPVGQAVMELRKLVIAGEAPGIKKQSELFTDVLGHVNAPIMVLATYCHYAVIYRRSPIGLPVPDALAKQPEAEKLNSVLQEIAWHAAVSHPLSGVKP
jgi:hypothetical protein